MPIYEYRCPDCGHTFDVMQKFSDAPVTVCPSCAAGNVKKLISATSFVLKGGGWYKDHYGLKSGGGESSSSSTPAAAPDAAPAAAPSAPAATPAAAPSTPSTGGGSGS